MNSLATIFRPLFLRFEEIPVHVVPLDGAEGSIEELASPTVELPDGLSNDAMTAAGFDGQAGFVRFEHLDELGW